MRNEPQRDMWCQNLWSGYGDGTDKKDEKTTYDLIVEALHEGRTLDDVEREPELIAGATRAKVLSTISRNHRDLVATERRIVVRKIPPRREVYVEVIIGPPGTGKTDLTYQRWMDPSNPSEFTRKVFRLTCCKRNGTSMWFDGLDSMHKVIVIEDMDSWLPPTWLMQLLDEYALDLPWKGSHVRVGYEHVCILSNLHPLDWWGYRTAQNTPGMACECSKDQMGAILSRINGKIFEKTGPDYRGLRNDRHPFPAINPEYADELVHLT